MAGNAGPVAILLLALARSGTSAAVWLNAPFARQIASDPQRCTAADLVAATMGMERPVLPAPHQVARSSTAAC